MPICKSHPFPLQAIYIRGISQIPDKLFNLGIGVQKTVETLGKNLTACYFHRLRACADE